MSKFNAICLELFHGAGIEQEEILPATILILERTPLISMDLSELIRTMAPDSRIEVVREIEEVPQKLSEQTKFDLAFLGVSRDEVPALMKFEMELSRLERVVLTNRPEDHMLAARRGWYVEPRPFSPARIAEHLQAITF